MINFRPVQLPVVVAAIVTALVSTVNAELRIGERTLLTFASKDEGKEILTRRDEFVERLSPFDRSARLKTDQAISEERYLAFVGSQVLEWDSDEKERVEAAFHSVAAALTSLKLTLPDSIQLIKTSGMEEGQAAYTRANAIVLPRKVLTGSTDSIQRLLCHELFHVLSRADPATRERLYSAIGFRKCDEVQLPESLRLRRLTNPDAPKNDHCIEVTVDGSRVWAVPVLYSKQDSYDPSIGGEFFNYLVFKFLLVDHTPGTFTATPLLSQGEPRLIDVADAIGFMDQIGRNTNYIIHPEEILADNFVIVVGNHESDARSPEVASRVRAALRQP